MSLENSERVLMDGNEAAAHVAYRVSEVIAIYPITPSSPMAELSDQWSSERRVNIWGGIPVVQQMQSEAGAAGAVHGALQAGALATTFTSSQGLLLMVPNMYKIAGELTAFVLHVAARSVATHALSIFGDHSDVMATRATGFALLNAASAQEAMDFALIAQAATLQARIPFLHFFDGFRTSHELSSVIPLSVEQMRAMIDEKLVEGHRARGLSPDHPVVRGTAHNPDVFFQAREAANTHYRDCPNIVQQTMDRFAALTGRQYHLFDYYGAPDADRVMVIMGSGSSAVEETVDALRARGERVGVLKVRLFRPWAADVFLKALPSTVKTIAVLDRTKEPGSAGEPMYLDVVEAVKNNPQAARLIQAPVVIGGRYGLSSKEFTPAMAKGVFDEMKNAAPKNHFTVGIEDDITHHHLSYDPSFITEPENQTRAIFYGLGSDGTVSANKNSIKIISEHTGGHAQAYFVYDSKKSGSTTISHLRFGKDPIHASYLVQTAHVVACHQFRLLALMDVLHALLPGGIFLLNSPYAADQVWKHLPSNVQKTLIAKRPKFYLIDSYKIAQECGLGSRISSVMQACFFAVTGLMPMDAAIEAMTKSIQKSYGSKGSAVVESNKKAIHRALEAMQQVQIPVETGTEHLDEHSSHLDSAPGFVREVVVPLLHNKGDSLPVSCFPIDGTFPVGTSRWEKRNIAQEIPVWDESICIQCGKCVIVCPHAVIRAKVFDSAHLSKAPAPFKSTKAMDRDWQGMSFSLQVAPEDCTGCAICVDVCPVKSKQEPSQKALRMVSHDEVLDRERDNWDFFSTLPQVDRRRIKTGQVRSNQLMEPLFEFSGACAGCGETPYLKLVSQLFGDRAMIANATGCSSIYGGNLPTTPWTKNSEGRGPAWANSLFEDNAEFGLGFRLALNQKQDSARHDLHALEEELGSEFVKAIVSAPQANESDLYEQRLRVDALKEKLTPIDRPEARRLLQSADALVRKSVWIIGGDGWAYDIDFGGLDHVLASGHDVNVLILDTEVYSNTGGQMSKSTPKGAVAKFSALGKSLAKKDLGLMAMNYGHVYVASVALGASDEQTVRALLEAEAYPGPSVVIAYSHCIAHGINMTTAMRDQKSAVQSGYWPLYRFNPLLAHEGKNPLKLDAHPSGAPLEDFMYKQNRFKTLLEQDTTRAQELLDQARRDIEERWARYEYFSKMGNP